MTNTAIHKRNKLNQLLSSWPSGVVLSQLDLQTQGISRQLSRSYVQNGWLKKIGQGAYQKAGDQVDWPGGLYCLQNKLNYAVHLGGYSLFDLKGGSHFIALSTNRPLLIYSTVKSSKKKLPKWFLEGFNDSIKIVYRKRELFKKPIGIEWFAYSNFSIKVSTRERALMEVLASVPLGCSYSHAVLLFQGKETLQPKLIQELLESCLSYKVKRLFLHLAKKCDLKWLNYLNLERIDIGQGKRQIGEGGLYDPEQQISVPKLNVLDDPDMEVEV